jgi:hypothetical protein
MMSLAWAGCGSEDDPKRPTDGQPGAACESASQCQKWACYCKLGGLSGCAAGCANRSCLAPEDLCGCATGDSFERAEPVSGECI